MTDALSTTEIKKRSIKGTKWLLLMNGMGMPAAFLIALMLGRVGPAALGIYALAQILIGVITTFVVYGGPPVLSVFMPKLPDAVDRGRFLFSYMLILLVMMGGVLGLFRLFPKGFEFLLQRKFDMENYGWFVLLALVIVVAETLANAASGLMLIKATAIARQMMRLILLPLVAVLFFFKREILVDYGMVCILGGFLAGYLAAAVICAVSIGRDQRFKMRPGWLLPHGFWAFSLTTMAATVFSFLYTNFDRMAVLSIQDVEGLGMYQAVLTINMFTELIPNVLLPSVIPTFSNLLGANHHAAFKRAFSILCRWSVVPITVVSLVIMGFSREILGMFGKQYVGYAYLLTLFSFVGIIRSLRLPSLVIVTCMEKNFFRFFQSFFMILAQCALTIVFMSRYGIVAIAGSKMVCVSAASVAGVLYVVYWLGMAPKLPLSYKVAVFAGTVMTILRIWVVPAGWLPATVLTLTCVMAFLGFSRFSWVEVRGIISFIIRHDVGVLARIVESEQSTGVEKEK